MTPDELREAGDGVYVATSPVIAFTGAEVAWLKQRAAATARGRARLCAHRSSGDPLHEMLIVLDASTYVRPHRHRAKSESFHVIEGRLTVILFDDGGAVRRVLALGDYASGRAFFFRLDESAYHTVLPEPGGAVIHETTNGPFDPADTERAPWAPAEDDPAAAAYRARLAASIAPVAP
jgi:cupin fold WbuC family metalloprotein